MKNIALIGYGYWGPNVARNIYNNPELNLIAICDKKQERLEKAKRVFIEQTEYIQNIELILNLSSIDAVAIAVETSSHYEIARKALEKGKDVYIEKPFTSTVAEAESLKKLAEKQGCVIHVDHIMVFHPCIRKIKEFIDEGSLGELMYFEASRMNLGQLKQDVSSMWDLAVHDLSIVDYFCNGINPDFISAVGEKWYSSKESLTFLMFKENKFLGHMKSSWISPVKERRIIIAGTQKMIVYDDMKVDEKVGIYDKGFDFVDGNIEYQDYVVKARSGDLLFPTIPVEDALYNSIEHFRICCEDRTASISGPDQAIRILKILEQADFQMRKKNTAILD